MADFISIYGLFAQEILINYQWLIGILFTAGLSLLVYFKLLRINNFLAYSQKYQENLKSFAILEDLHWKDSEMLYKSSGKEVNESDSLNLVIVFNLLSEVGLLYRKGLIDHDLVYRHFGNVVYALYTKHRSFVTHIQNHTKTDNIEFLFKKFSAKGVRGDQAFKLKVFLKNNLSWMFFPKKEEVR